MKRPMRERVGKNSNLSSHVSTPTLSRVPPPRGRSAKRNFDVAIQSNFAVVAAVLSDSSGCIISASTRKLLSVDVNLGETAAALLAVQLASLEGYNSLFFGRRLTKTALIMPVVFLSGIFLPLLLTSNLHHCASAL